ncbi:MAG: type II secretion system F family protein [archaeon]
MRVPLMLLNYNWLKVILRPFLGLGKIIGKIFPGLEFDLVEADLNLNVAEYTTTTFFNSIFYFVVFFLLMFGLSFRIAARDLIYSLFLSLGVAVGLFILFFIILMRYPKVLSGKRAENVDKTLLFALKDLLLQVSSGVSIYNSFVNISQAKYGLVSDEFRLAAQEINTGTDMERALEHMAKRTKSTYLRRSLWQLVNTMKVGASLEGALKTIIEDLARDQRSKIKDYAKELNLWTLLYMLFAVAIPTLGVTMLVVLSGFAGFGVSSGAFTFLIIVVIIIQIAIIGFIKTRRPIVQL